MRDSGYQDVDISITVQELAALIRAGGIDFSELPDTPFDDPFGEGSGAGLIFGATGGVMEAALRTVYAVVTGKEMEHLDYTPVRGFEGIKESQVDLNGRVIKVAVAHGIKNAKILLEKVKNGTADYQLSRSWRVRAAASAAVEIRLRHGRSWRSGRKPSMRQRQSFRSDSRTRTGDPENL